MADQTEPQGDDLIRRALAITPQGVNRDMLTDALADHAEDGCSAEPGAECVAVRWARDILGEPAPPAPTEPTSLRDQMFRWASGKALTLLSGDEAHRSREFANQMAAEIVDGAWAQWVAPLLAERDRELEGCYTDINGLQRDLEDWKRAHAIVLNLQDVRVERLIRELDALSDTIQDIAGKLTEAREDSARRAQENARIRADLLARRNSLATLLGRPPRTTDVGWYRLCQEIDDRHTATVRERDQARAEVERLTGALREAVETCEDMAPYVDSYYRAKWGWDETIARLRRLVPPVPAGPAADPVAHQMRDMEPAPLGGGAPQAASPQVGPLGNQPAGGPGSEGQP